MCRDSNRYYLFLNKKKNASLTCWNGFVRFLITTNREHSSHEVVWEIWNHFTRQLSWTHFADPAHLHGLIKTSSPLLWQILHSSSSVNSAHPPFEGSTADEERSGSSLDVLFLSANEWSLQSALPIAPWISLFFDDPTTWSFSFEEFITVMSRRVVTASIVVRLSKILSSSSFIQVPSMSSTVKFLLNCH